MWPAYRGQSTGRWASPMKGITCSNDKAPLRERPAWLRERWSKGRRLTAVGPRLCSILIAVEELSYRPTLMCKLLQSAAAPGRKEL